MDFEIEGKNALVAGSDSGIGFATAKLLAGEGANRVLTDKTTDELERAVEEVRKSSDSGASDDVRTADLRENQQVLELRDFVKKRFGGLDILVHCAGIRGAAGDFLSLTDEDWLESIDVDLMSAVRVSRVFLPMLLEKGSGRNVLISSENALEPYVEESPYNNAAKAGIINLTKCLSQSYSRRGVMINCVSHAFIATPMNDYMMDQIETK